MVEAKGFRCESCLRDRTLDSPLPDSGSCNQASGAPQAGGRGKTALDGRLEDRRSGPNAPGPVSAAWVRDQLERLAAELPPGQHRRDFELYGTTHAERFAGLLSEILAHSPPDPSGVLDVGSFPGHFTLLLKRLGYAVAALAQPLGAHFAVAPYNEALRAAGVPRVECDIERGYAPLSADAFGAAVFSEVIEHLAFNPFHALAEICRVLKPGGRLWLTTPNLASARYVLRLLRGRSIGVPIDSPWSEAFPTARGLKHEREYTAEEIRRFFSPGDRHAYGFDQPRIEFRNWLGDTPGALGPRARRIESTITRLFRRFDNTLLATAVKPAGLRLFTPAELALEGEWGPPADPLTEVRFPCPSPYPYPFRYLRGEATISFQMPEGWPPPERPTRLLLPWVWHVTEPPLPDQPVAVEEINAAKQPAGAAAPVRFLVRPDRDMRIVSIPLGKRPPEAAREVRLRFRPERPVRPDDILGNGDRVFTGPALAEAHWALRCE